MVRYITISVCRREIEKKERIYILIFCFADTGYDIFAKKKFSLAEFLLEYPAKLITYEEALERQKQYETSNKGCFIYFLEDKKKMIG